MTLRRVITARIHEECSQFDIPYKESKLTTLLESSMNGNFLCLMIACLNPSDDHYEENLSTLLYTNKISGKKNKEISKEPYKAS